MKEFLLNLDLQNMWEHFSEQIGIWIDIATSKLSVFLEHLYQQSLANPLPAGAILLALIGIPLIFLKVNKTKSESETDGRLDQLMEEMQSFEIKTPMGDLQKKFSESPIANMEPPHEEDSFKFDSKSNQGFSDSDHVHETLDSDSMIELPSLISDEENREDDTSFLSEEQETEDISSLADSNENQSQLDKEELELEDMPEVSDWFEISRETLSAYDDTELSIEGIENLQQKLEESTREFSLEIPSANKEDLKQELTVGSTSPIPDPVEPTSLNGNLEETVSANHEEGNNYQKNDSALPSIDPVAPEPEEERKLTVAKDDYPIPHQEMVEENFDNQIQSTVAVSEKIINESPLTKLPLKQMPKSQPDQTRIKSSDKIYKDLLESFILLKDQKR
jgi:hypothetical protein